MRDSDLTLPQCDTNQTVNAIKGLKLISNPMRILFLACIGAFIFCMPQAYGEDGDTYPPSGPDSMSLLQSLHQNGRLIVVETTESTKLFDVVDTTEIVRDFNVIKEALHRCAECELSKERYGILAMDRAVSKTYGRDPLDTEFKAFSVRDTPIRGALEELSPVSGVQLLELFGPRDGDRRRLSLTMQNGTVREALLRLTTQIGCDFIQLTFEAPRPSRPGFLIFVALHDLNGPSH